MSENLRLGKHRKIHLCFLVSVLSVNLKKLYNHLNRCNTTLSSLHVRILECLPWVCIIVHYSYCVNVANSFDTIPRQKQRKNLVLVQKKYCNNLTSAKTYTIIQEGSVLITTVALSVNSIGPNFLLAHCLSNIPQHLQRQRKSIIFEYL